MSHDTEMLDTEIQMLQNLMPDPTEISKIINVYHQVIKVSSMCTALSTRDIDAGTQAKIAKAREIIKHFDSNIHPRILESLSNSIQESIKILESNTDKDPKLYEELRRKMSTLEFVKQYEKLS